MQPPGKCSLTALENVKYAIWVVVKTIKGYGWPVVLPVPNTGMISDVNQMSTQIVCETVLVKEYINHLRVHRWLKWMNRITNQYGNRPLIISYYTSLSPYVVCNEFSMTLVVRLKQPLPAEVWCNWPLAASYLGRGSQDLQESMMLSAY